ncbi:hypothetical protein LELG_03745 [Lodderomyces elongisporus NRRL YB-4239]|uniref:Myosin motor domain-containing protein n=1 Tax=Lodderomyces elongisporus (strain ATCC 11503 / CBS 2605 / JCM 1781 / NBRC 1676 / NRRL YB-4239) TaxID=379508 RepID=A5E2A8_LODEL|nr:hypothetical protein LELG_03745 [Lodderomyces elongisporus NRRL YB-4239]
MPLPEEGEASTLKNWVWVPDDKQLFCKGFVTDYLEDGTCKVSIVSPTDGSVQSTEVIQQSKLENCNPTKFDKCDDMAELTHLNEPSVVHNMYLRYMDDLIYTYSGLFLVAINPYKLLSIYQDTTLQTYHDKNDVGKAKPHIFATAEGTYRNLLSNKKNQSILVTGESGAGKTENTKKVIQYLSSITGSHQKKIGINLKGEDSIEDKILQANPVLESFGNAKTIKNNNSSRFGKFIKIFFDTTGNLTGANIDYYLLEKSRVVNQSKNERNYHVFYQFLKGYESLPSLGLSKDIKSYEYLKSGQSSIPNVDDFKEFNLLVEAFKIVGFQPNEMQFIYLTLAVILHLGNLKFTSMTAEQASFTTESPLKQIANLLGVPELALRDNFLKPKVKAGRELVTKSKKANEVKFAIDAFAKYLYEKLFQYIIKRINANLHNHDEAHVAGNFIGVLDIAGFEIFEKNSFEQLCINYTNEKLQQFFNHHSFILEQSEYLRENIQWDFIDFGKDLQPTIDLIETKTPMGILKLLDEECMMPKSSDKMFMEKLSQNFASSKNKNNKNNNKNKKFAENKYKNGFIIHHYAGSVEYNVDNWLQKNTDPISENILALLTTSTNETIVDLFNDDPHLKTAGSKMMRTASQKHKDQLKELMDQLESTEPHFVRCILPNLEKQPKRFDKGLVLNQLRCNGVLEGIRITRAGYPNKLLFQDFIHRYSILCEEGLQSCKHEKQKCELILKTSNLDSETYKVGLTKIFFKNAILGQLEAKRDIKLKTMFIDVQRVIRGMQARKLLQTQIMELRSAKVVAKTMTQLQECKENPWMKLFFHIKPLLEDSVKALDTKAVQENLKDMTVKLKDTERLKDGLEKDNLRLRESMSKLEDEIISRDLVVEKKDQLVNKLKAEEESALKRIQELESSLKDLKERNTELESEYETLNNRLKSLHDDHETKTKDLLNVQGTYDATKIELDLLKKQMESSTLDKESTQKLIHDFEEEQKVLQAKLQKATDESQELFSQLEKARSLGNEIVEAHDKCLPQIENLNKIISKYKAENENHKRDIEKLQSQIKSDDSKKSKYELKIDEAKEKISALKVKVEKKGNEIEQQKVEISNLRSELNKVQHKLNEHEDQSVELNKLKLREMQNFGDLQESKKRLSQITSDHSKLAQDHQRLQIEYEESKKAKEEYSKMVFSLNLKLSELEQDLKNHELEKENQDPNPQMMQEFANMKLKMNEQSALLRLEKFENRKLSEELQLLKTRIINGSLTGSDLTPKRKSLAIGERVNGSVDALNKEINDLKISLQQEQANFQRAENYAIELQKKLNKLQSTRGINSSFDYESKLKESQNRICDLENKLEGLVSYDSNSIDDTNNTSTNSAGMPRAVSRSESLNGLAFRGVNQDFIQIYQDMNKTLKSTREELSTSKSEILRLKSLLRESEEELYLIKQEKYRTAMDEFEQQLADIKVKYENTKSTNKELAESLDLYKKRSEEFTKKLELAESAVVISKRQTEQAERDMNELRSQLRLAKEEARTSQIMLKESRGNIDNLENKLHESEQNVANNKRLISELQDKLAYHVQNYENREANDKLKEEIRVLHKELDFKTETEVTLVKENKKLQLDLEDAVLSRKNIQNQLDELVLREEELEMEIEKLTDFNRLLTNSGIVNERKVNALTKQVTSLKEFVEEVQQEKTKLVEEKSSLQSELSETTSELESKTLALEHCNAEISFLKTHLENQKEDAEAIRSELNQSKMSSTSDYRDQQKLRNDLLITNEENYSLKKANKELTLKVQNLEEKLYNNEQIKYLEARNNEISNKLDASIQTRHEHELTIKSLERQVKQLEVRAENESQLSKRYNNENFEFQNKINHYKSTVDILQTENMEKDLQLNTLQEERDQLKESLARMERELAHLRSMSQ